MQSVIHGYDVLMLAVLVGTILFGAWKGMAWQLASLASVVVSAGVAFHFGGLLAPMMGQTEPWNRFIAMLVLYLATSLVIWLIFRIVSRLIDRVQLKEFDRQIGALFGLIKGVLLCVLITFFAVTLSERARQRILESFSGHAIARGIERADPVIPEEVRAVLGKYIQELDRKLDPSVGVDQPLADKFDADEWLRHLEENKYDLDDTLGLDANRGRGGQLDETLDGAAGKIEELSRRAADGLQHVR